MTVEGLYQSKISDLHSKAFDLGFRGTKEELIDSLFGKKKEGMPWYLDSQFDLTGRPERLIEQTANRHSEINKLLSIHQRETHPEGNLIDIGDKEFSVLNPEVDGINIHQRSNGLKLIALDAVEDEVTKAGGQLFATDEELVEFINNNIPGRRFPDQIGIFSRLMGVGNTTFRASREGVINCQQTMKGNRWSVVKNEQVKNNPAVGREWWSMTGAVTPVIMFKNK